jgi:lysyl-tRNA synthetase class 2
VNDHVRWLNPNESGWSRKQVLEARHLIKRVVRDVLHDHGFIEIDTPLLVHGTTPDAMIDSFEVDGRYLITSSEYQLKRMEAGGFEKLYSLGPNFRAGDHGPYRNPEFTMLEWARAGGTLADIEADTEEMFHAALAATGGKDVLRYRGHDISLARPWKRLTVAEAVKAVLGHTPENFEGPSLLRIVEAAGLPLRPEMRDDRDFLFALIMERVQESLGFETPVFLTDWPAFQSASTTGNADGIAERSELIIAGIEVSDGFPTLTDVGRQRQNFETQQARRIADGKQPVALDERYLAMMEGGLPPGAGMALGFDRMVMLLTNQATISSALAFGWREV